ncbi:MAG: hypothetical protein H7A35_01790 [Planctomycetales bacterium]|nr:hypothetical protein [bacterium]UNM08790.1 MAG: hypothetical protein H7A35_01790 [Planctomycetales bacterium]
MDRPATGSGTTGRVISADSALLTELRLMRRGMDLGDRLALNIFKAIVLAVLASVLYWLNPVLIWFVIPPAVLVFTADNPSRPRNGQLGGFRRLANENLLGHGLLAEVMSAGSVHELLGQEPDNHGHIRALLPKRFRDGRERIDFLLESYAVLCESRGWPAFADPLSPLQPGEHGADGLALDAQHRRELLDLLIELLEGGVDNAPLRSALDE